jgi:hypothetical protein
MQAFDFFFSLFPGQAKAKFRQGIFVVGKA